MNENDKILIHTYLDGETSNEDSKYVESLLESNNEANEYANNIKKANNEINSFFNSSDIKELEQDISSYVDTIKSKKQKTNFLNRMLKPQSFIGYALAASIAYFILTPLNINEENVKLFLGDLSEYSEELGYVNFPKYRGELEVDESLKNILTDSIEYMIENKLVNAVATYGSDSYYIKLESLALNEEYKYCLNGYYKYLDNENKFKFCKEEDESSITFN